MSELGSWYARHGRHELPWRSTNDRWAVLVSEVMLAQTQVARVREAWPAFMDEFPTPERAAAAGVGALIRAWGRLGYPLRARRLWQAAVIISRDGWPGDYRDLPGVGRYTAGALAAQVDNCQAAVAVDVNIRRVTQRVVGTLLTVSEAEAALVQLSAPLDGRDRLLAVMDLGAMLCTPHEPACERCPVRHRCATRGPLVGETRSRQATYQGSFRQRRGEVLAALRASSSVRASELDAEALASLVADRLAAVSRGRARLPLD